MLMLRRYDYEFDLNGATYLGCIPCAGVSLEQYAAALTTIRPHINPPDPTPEEKRETEKAKEAKARMDLFQNAEKLTEWEGWIYWEGSLKDVEDFSDEWARDGYWESVDDLLSSIAAYNAEGKEEDADEYCVEIPSYVWCCRACCLAHTDARDLFAERLEKKTYEDAWDHLPAVAVAELQEALDKFYAKTDKLVGYLPDYSKALILEASNV